MPRRAVKGAERRKSWILIELLHGRRGRGGRARFVFWTHDGEGPAAEWRGSMWELREREHRTLVSLLERIVADHAAAREIAAGLREQRVDALPVAQYVRELFLLQAAERIMKRSESQEAER